MLSWVSMLVYRVCMGTSQEGQASAAIMSGRKRVAEVTRKSSLLSRGFPKGR